MKHCYAYAVRTMQLRLLSVDYSNKHGGGGERNVGIVQISLKPKITLHAEAALCNCLRITACSPINANITPFGTACMLCSYACSHSQVEVLFTQDGMKIQKAHFIPI